MRRCLLILLGFLTGCSGYNPGTNPEPVEISGTVMLSGKPVSGWVLNFQATGAGAQATMPVRDGKFKGSVIPGKYTYFLAESSEKGVRPTPPSIPEKYLTGSLDRQIDISAGQSLNLNLD